MTPISEIRTVPPEHWACIAGIWIKVHTLHDPLLRADLHRVTVHRNDQGHAWIHAEGNNAGIQIQSTPPAEEDLP